MWRRERRRDACAGCVASPIYGRLRHDGRNGRSRSDLSRSYLDGVGSKPRKDGGGVLLRLLWLLLLRLLWLECAGRKGREGGMWEGGLR